MINKLKKLFTVALALCCLQISFANTSLAGSHLPKGGKVSSKDLEFLDKPLEILDILLFTKARYFVASTLLLAAIIMFKTIMISIPLFLSFLGLAFFPLINKGFFKMGSTKGILKDDSWF